VEADRLSCGHSCVFAVLAKEKLGREADTIIDRIMVFFETGLSGRITARCKHRTLGKLKMEDKQKILSHMLAGSVEELALLPTKPLLCISLCCPFLYHPLDLVTFSHILEAAELRRGILALFVSSRSIRPLGEGRFGAAMGPWPFR
jgi:hypothetical protein